MNISTIYFIWDEVYDDEAPVVSADVRVRACRELVATITAYMTSSNDYYY